MASSKNMIITERGLNTLSRELLNRRKFQTRLITVIGTPNITDGVAISIDNESYFKHDGLKFTDSDKVSISFKGSYVETEKGVGGQVLWSMAGTGVDPVTLLMFKDKISLYRGTKNLGDIARGPFVTGKYINIKLSIEKNKFIATYVYDSNYNIVSGQLQDIVYLSKYTSVNIGAHIPNLPWLGSIDLNDFIIYKGDEVYYAPSTEASFHFTKVLISNGNLPLNDNSTPLINNVYEFDITEIKRTGNNLLFLARVDSDVYLDIKEVGLYSYTDEGPMLFSKITGLSIKKQKDIGYGLLFNINVNLGVVNTVALPEIVVHEKDNISQKDFSTVKRVHTYITIDMERVITMNALNLGYGRAQKVEKNYAKLSSWANNSNNTQNFLKSNENVQSFLKVSDKINSAEERTFNINKINVVGDLNVTENGVASNFSTANYAYVNYIDSDDSNWKYTASFNLEQINSSQTIIEGYGRTANIPLAIRVDASNNCSIELGKREELEIFNNILNVRTNYVRKSFRDSIGEPTFYAWENKAGAAYANAHIIPKGDVFNRNGVLKNFSSTNYAVAPKAWNLGNKFSLTIKFSKSTDPVTGEQVLISADKDFIFQVSMNQEKRLLYRIGNGTAWLNTDVYQGKAIILTEEEQELLITFDGSTYEAKFTVDGVEADPDWTFASAEVLPTFTAVFGQKFDHTLPWVGYINLTGTDVSYGDETWSGASMSKYIYTKQISPNTSSAVYDEDKQVFNGAKITKFTGGTLFKEFLSKISKLVDYYISAEYKEGSYEVYLKEGNLDKKLVFKRESNERINSMSELFIGIDKDKKNPIKGTMFLEDMDIISGENDYSPVDKEFKEKNLKDYFYITEYPYSSFKAINLKDPDESSIKVVEGALLGNKDNIDFDNPKGFSLCVKMFLKDGADEVILAKVNKLGTRYFVLKYEKEALIFTLYQKEGKIELKKQYKPTTFRQITDYPVTIFITYNGNPYQAELRMYKNNELLDEFTEPMKGFFDAGAFKLTNYIDFNQPSEVNDVINIISFEGELSENEIFLINNLLDTNF